MKEIFDKLNKVSGERFFIYMFCGTTIIYVLIQGVIVIIKIVLDFLMNIIHYCFPGC